MNHTFCGIKQEFPLQYPPAFKALVCNSNDTSMPPYIETTIGYTSLMPYTDNQILGLRAVDHTPSSTHSQNKRRKADCDCSQNPILKDLNSFFVWSPSQINPAIRRNEKLIKSPGPQAWCQESPRGGSSAEDPQNKLLRYGKKFLRIIWKRNSYYRKEGKDLRHCIVSLDQVFLALILESHLLTNTRMSATAAYRPKSSD